VNSDENQLSNTKDLRRSNSLSAFHSSIKIMEEASNYLIRTKEQLAKHVGEPDHLGKGKKKGKKKRAQLLRRQSSHTLTSSNTNKKIQKGSLLS
jgi:hypothetical protein